MYNKIRILAISYVGGTLRNTYVYMSVFLYLEFIVGGRLSNWMGEVGSV